MSTLRTSSSHIVVVSLATLAFAVFCISAPIAHAEPTPVTGNPATPVTGNPATPVTGNPASDGSTAVLQNPLGNIDSLPKLIDAILGAVVELGSVLLVVMLVYVGFLFVLARGNPEEISKARSALIWTLIGGLILLGAKAIEVVITATVAGLGS